MSGFVMTPLKDIISVTGLYTLHYFEYSKTYSFEGEAHGFWEMVYVDRGSVRVRADNHIIKLNQGEAIFHKPDEFHAIESMGDYSNTVVISFECDSAAMSFFENKALKLNKQQREIIFKMVTEGKEIFSEPLNIVDQKEMKPKSELSFGAMQMLKIYLEELLIMMTRTNNALSEREKSPTSSRGGNRDDTFGIIVDYLEQNIDKNVTLDSVCNHFFFSKTYIKILFKNITGKGLIAYFNEMKLKKAKQLISLDSFTFTEIAAMLSYSSIHYFSRCFKTYTGMTPTEYSQSVKSTGIL